MKIVSNFDANSRHSSGEKSQQRLGSSTPIGSSSEKSPTPDVRPPLDNMGVKLTNHTQDSSVGSDSEGNEKDREVGPDWISGTFPLANLSRIKSVVSSALGNDSFAQMSHGITAYREAFRSALGAIIGLDPTMPAPHQKNAYLQLTGSVVRQIPPKRLQRLCASLDSLSFSPSRFDIACDDYHKRIHPRQLYDEYLANNIVGFRKTGQFRESTKRGQLASTFSVGNRGSSGGGKFYQCYMKSVESDKVIDSHRHEVSLYGEHAKQAFDMLVNTPLEHWAELLYTTLFNTIDFVDRSQKSRTSRCERLQFWSDFLGKIGVIKLYRKLTKKSYENSKKWIERQVAPTLAYLLHAYGYETGSPDAFMEFFWQTIFNGESRFNSFQHASLKQIQMQNPAAV